MMHLKNFRKIILVFLSIAASVFYGNAQVGITSASLNAYHITPRSLCEVTVMNYGQQEVQVVLEAKLFNSGNELLVTVRTQPFYVKPGMNLAAALALNIQSAQFASSAQANYLQTAHTLPSGKFRHCCTLIPVNMAEEGDDYCDEIESDLSSSLFLVSPPDKEVIETPHPVLLWSHSEPFNLMAAGEYYRIVVAEIGEGQDASSALAVNHPVYMKNNLTTHQVQYPYDAKTLEKGKRYAWQIQRLANGVITNQSEAWEFTLGSDASKKDNKYAVLKKTQDAGYYTASNNKVFFKFEEEYAGSQLQCAIYNAKREQVLPKARSESAKNKGLNAKQGGYNCYEIDLDEMNIRKGMHTLEVENEKGELFVLKFYVE